MDDDLPDPDLTPFRPMGNCDVCGAAGVFHITEVAGGIPRAFLLCIECAAKHLNPPQQSQPESE